MYVVWRQRPVKGKGGGPFLMDDPQWKGTDCASPWKPLECRHRGEGRTAWTPLIVVASRVDGKPRQRVLHRFPTIRTCCIADPFNRAAWWFEVEADMEDWADFDGKGDALATRPLALDLARDRAAILAKLREVVPPPTPKGRARFAAYHAGMVAEKEARDNADREWWYSPDGPGGKARKQREQAEANGWRSAHPFDASYVEFNQRNDARREQQERSRRVWEEFNEAFGTSFDPGAFGFGASAGAGATGGDCYAVLGIAPTASVDEIKAAFRELAKLHHPDGGGDAAEFNRVKVASEQALRRATRAAG